MINTKMLIRMGCFVLFLTSGQCIYAQNNITLNAKVKGVEQRKVYLYDGILTEVIDSTIVYDDQFLFTKALAEPRMYSITIDDVLGFVSFVWDEDMTIHARRDSLYNARVVGSSANDLWNYHQRQHIDPTRDSLVKLTTPMQEAMAANDSITLAQITDQQKSFLNTARMKSVSLMKKYPHSFVSLYLLNHYAGDFGPDSTLTALANLSDRWRSHSIYQQLVKWANNKKKVSAGNTAPSFTATTFDGEQVSLDDLKGNYVVLDFWGTWCGPCIEVIPELKAIHRKYQDQAVKLISVACEVGKDEATMLRKAKKFVAKKEMDWLHILENKASADQETSLIYQYGVDVYPSAILISPEGKILFFGEGKHDVKQIDNILAENLN